MKKKYLSLHLIQKRMRSIGGVHVSKRMKLSLGGELVVSDNAVRIAAGEDPSRECVHKF